MEKQIDCTGLQCPAPVLKTKEVIEHEPVEHIHVKVDNDAAAENVSRFLDYNGFDVSMDSDGAISTVSGRKNADKVQDQKPLPEAGQQARTPDSSKILVMITAARIGKGDDELGGKLMLNFIKTLKEMGSDLWRVVFLNHGVTLCTRGSAHIDALRALEEEGVSLLVCGACLDHLGLLDKKEVGQTTNMLDIVTSAQLSDNIINL